MFLCELVEVLSNAIHRRLFASYSGIQAIATPTSKRWDEIIDTTIALADDSTTVKKLLEEHMLHDLRAVQSRHDCLPRRRSALLFGPPGTSKTSLVRAFADVVAWPFVEINPSHFLEKGLDGIYVRTNEIFDDLKDFSNVVILFDELDALVKRRPEADSDAPLDVTREFLTTSMLPKLATLHDRARVVFFMATNHQRYFDSAIKRPGRFDLHIFMGVPSWKEKRARLAAFLPLKAPANEIGDVIDIWLATDAEREAELLTWFSFGEFRAFIDDFCGPLRPGIDPGQAFDVSRRQEFLDQVRVWGERLIVLREKLAPGKEAPNPTRQEYEHDRGLSRIQ
jgi:SpoVK/Ycf46/Vps4 family AAA+-type ATPase